MGGDMRTVLALAVALTAAGCVSEETFRKKELEAEKYRQDWVAEAGKRASLEQRVENMKVQVDSLELDVKSLREKIKSDEDNLSAKQSELGATQSKVAELQALVDELSKSKKKLEAAKAELEKKSAEFEQVSASLKGEIEAGRIELSELRGKVTVKMKDKVLFGSGSATLNAEGKESLRQVAAALQTVRGKLVRVEGHTDNVPTARGGPFPTNWELSTARALAVLRFLQDAGVDPTRLAAAGYGEFKPIFGNDTPEGRAQNRRIEIVLAPAEGAVPTAPAAAPARM
jgi:chemotaxis protein MotB